MERSETIIELAKATSAFQGQITSVPKRRDNPFYKARYADLDAIWDVVRKPLHANGLSLLQMTFEQQDRLYLETVLLHTSGEWVRTCLPVNPLKPEPQAIGSAITYARRYAMSALLGISAEDDDDGEAAMGRQAATSKQKQAASEVQPKTPPPAAPAPNPTAPANTTPLPERWAVFAEGFRAIKGDVVKLSDLMRKNYNLSLAMTSTGEPDLSNLPPNLSVHAMSGLEAMLEGAKQARAK